jgi:hypothetical protein
MAGNVSDIARNEFYINTVLIDGVRPMPTPGASVIVGGNNPGSIVTDRPVVTPLPAPIAPEQTLPGQQPDNNNDNKDGIDDTGNSVYVVGPDSGSEDNNLDNSQSKPSYPNKPTENDSENEDHHNTEDSDKDIDNDHHDQSDESNMEKDDNFEAEQATEKDKNEVDNTLGNDDSTLLVNNNTYARTDDATIKENNENQISIGNIPATGIYYLSISLLFISILAIIITTKKITKTKSL